MNTRDRTIAAIRRHILEIQKLVPDEPAAPVNYVTLRVNILLREFDIEVKALLDLLEAPEHFAETFKARYMEREHRDDLSIPFDACRCSPVNQLYWKIAVLVFKPKTMKEILAIMMPNVTRLLTVSFPDQLPAIARDPQTLRSAVDNLVPEFILENLDSLTAAPTLDELSHYVLLDNMIFDVRTIRLFSLPAHSQFYKALQHHHPDIAKKLYSHNYSLTLLKSDILSFQSKGKTPRAALEQLKKAFVLSGQKMTGSEFASTRAAIAVTEFMRYIDNVPNNIKEKLLSLKGTKILKEIIDEIKSGNCVESIATMIHWLLENNADNPLLNAIIPTTSLDPLLKRYRYSQTKANALSTQHEDPETHVFPALLLRSAMHGMTIKHPDDLIDLILNFPPDYYELLFTNIRIDVPNKVLINIRQIIEANILSPEQYQALLDVIVKLYVRSYSYSQTRMLAWLMCIKNPDLIKWIIQHYGNQKEMLINAITSSAVASNSYSVLHSLVENTQSFQMVFELIPKEKRLTVVNTSNLFCSTVLHYATRNPEALRMVLAIYSDTERMKALEMTCANGRTPLHWSIKQPESMQMILTLYPKPKRLELVKTITREGNTLLHLAASYPESVHHLLKLYPRRERLAAVKAINRNDESVFYCAVHKLESLKVMLTLIPKLDRLQAVCIKEANGNSVLQKAIKNPELMQLILQMLPETQRLEVIRSRGMDGRTALHNATVNPTSLRVLLELIPKHQRLSAVKMTTEGGRSTLHMISLDPESLQIVLDLLPEEDRLEVLAMVDEEGGTVLHDAAKYSASSSLHEILLRLPTEHRREAVRVIDRHGESVLQAIDHRFKSSELKNIYLLMYGDQAALVVKEALLNFMDILRQLLVDKKPDYWVERKLSYFFQGSHAKTVLLGELKALFSTVKDLPGAAENLDIFLKWQSTLNNKVEMFKHTLNFIEKTSSWFQSIQGFLNQYKLPVDGAHIDYASECAEAGSDGIRVGTRNP